MDKTIKTVRTFYLYVVSLLSLIFLAVGIGNLANTTLKATIFKEAEKRDYSVCYSYPYYISSVDLKNLEELTVDQNEKIESMIRDYEAWQETNTGESCYRSERENRIVNSLTIILIALPLYIFHWAIIKKEKKENED
ncbi:MAG: hypothetical protein XE08_0459 [Parcubacteria bacterium 32_520]|nr:MAG: hypothetical protein XD75_0401 [Parcubacteria bacterium 33_209]KUK98702.1 MAG: hypothetical protein XE08_0459 [Parcubacteria bacterium 32_520]